MAEGSGGWWSSWVNTAKAKSAEVYEFVKKDMDELSSAVKNEAKIIASSAADVLQLDKEDSTANTVKKSLSSFFDSLSDVFVPPPTDDDVPVLVKDGIPVPMTPMQLKYYELITDERTFTVEVENDRFSDWVSVSEDLLEVDRLTNLLANNPLLQEKYAALVPDSVSHSDFWKRYLFRRALLEDEEAEKDRRKPIPEPQNVEVPPEKPVVPPVISETPSGVLELSEEEQTRLLTQYELEINALEMREKRDLVIVSSGPTEQQSSKESSTDGEWEKEFELDDDKIASNS